MSVFTGASECLDHLGLVKVAMEAVELVQPEVVTLKVERCLWWIVWVSSQIAEVLHQHKCAVEFLLRQGRVLCHATQGSRARCDVGGCRRKSKLVDGCRAVTL